MAKILKVTVEAGTVCKNRDGEEIGTSLFLKHEAVAESTFGKSTKRTYYQMFVDDKLDIDEKSDESILGEDYELDLTDFKIREDEYQVYVDGEPAYDEETNEAITRKVLRIEPK